MNLTSSALFQSRWPQIAIIEIIQEFGFVLSDYILQRVDLVMHTQFRRLPSSLLGQTIAPRRHRGRGGTAS
jgi:hypothetical protein